MAYCDNFIQVDANICYNKTVRVYEAEKQVSKQFTGRCRFNIIKYLTLVLYKYFEGFRGRYLTHACLVFYHNLNWVVKKVLGLVLER